MCQEVVDSVNQCEYIHIQKYMKAECWTVGLMHLSKQVVCMEVIVLCGFRSCVCVSAARATWQAFFSCLFVHLKDSTAAKRVCVCVCALVCLLCQMYPTCRCRSKLERISSPPR